MYIIRISRNVRTYKRPRDVVYQPAAGVDIGEEREN
jgi:hypothetical protein